MKTKEDLQNLEYSKGINRPEPSEELLKIKRLVEKYLKVRDISILTREDKIVMARQMYVKIASDETTELVASIMEFIGKQYSSRSYDRTAANNAIDVDKEVREAYRLIMLEYKQGEFAALAEKFHANLMNCEVI